jgi:hypothetical protein
LPHRPASDGNYYHTVSSGEYPAWIANLYEISLNELLSWNCLTANAVIRPGQQLLLRVTPPATATPTPAPPTATVTLTQTPLAPTPTQEIETPRLSITTTPGAGNQNGLPGIIVGLIIVLGVSGLFVIGWTVWQKSQKT